MNINALQIEKHLMGSAPSSPLYVVCGEDESLKSSVLSSLRAANEADDQPGSTTLEVDELEDHRRIFDELYTQPFLGMAGKRMVIVRRGEELVDAASDQLTEYAKKPSRTSILVLCCEKLGRRSNPGRTLSKNSVWVDCSKIKWDEARRWVAQQVRSEGLKIDGRAASDLVQSIGPHVTALKRELDKLVLYAAESGFIDQRAVHDVVPASRARTVFELSDAIAASKIKESVELGQTLLLHGEEPIMIVAFLSSRFRDLWQVYRLTKRRMPLRDIASEVGMPEFAVKRAAQAVRRRNDQWFARRLRMLSEADTALKTTSMPSKSLQTWLTGLIAGLGARD